MELARAVFLVVVSMTAGMRKSFEILRNDPRISFENGRREERASLIPDILGYGATPVVLKKTRVFIASENRLLQDAAYPNVDEARREEVVGVNTATPFCAESHLAEIADIPLLASRGSLAEDIPLIRKVRRTAPTVQIVIMGIVGDAREFLHYVRAGIRGYLSQDASAQEVWAAVRAVEAREAVCPGSFCGLLFQCLEHEAMCLPSASMHQRLGMTRREQQLIPLIAQGLTNKEIANHFCLSEQTVKNHLYRMKHKVGADNRLGIVQACHTQGFLL